MNQEKLSIAVAVAVVVCLVSLLVVTHANSSAVASVGSGPLPHDHAASATPPGTVSVPAIASRELSTNADWLLVCTYEGERPQSYRVLSRSCREGADYCTVFVAMSAADPIRLQEYDARNPPVAVAPMTEICTQPHHPATGVFTGVSAAR